MILTKFTNSCLGPGGQGWGVWTKIVGDADKTYISVVEADSKSDPFYLLQYNIDKFSISYFDYYQQLHLHKFHIKHLKSLRYVSIFLRSSSGSYVFPC